MEAEEEETVTDMITLRRGGTYTTQDLATALSRVQKGEKYAVVSRMINIPQHARTQRLRDATRDPYIIEYWSRRFVVGDSRGLRVAVVLSVGDALKNPLPVSLDTGEALPLTNFMRRRRNSSGTILDVNQVSGANYVPISSNPGRSWRLRMPALFGRRCPSLSSLQSVQLLLR
ncbi:hypothetical protein PC123_g5440 [Phytophthora cactorum]|nr:hypothetical protein PC123_g5440 [Phytophthora cactorum]